MLGRSLAISFATIINRYQTVNSFQFQKQIRMSSSLSSSSFPSTASAAAALLQFYVGEDKLDNIKTATEFVANAVSHPSLPKLIVLPEVSEASEL